MDQPATEPSADDVRSARRAVLAFRVLFYGGALIAAVVLLTGRASGGGVAYTLEGGTAQLESMRMDIDGDGDATFFDTEVRQTCTHGDEKLTRWFPADGDPVRFDQDGDDLRVEETWDREEGGVVQRGRATMKAKVADRRVTGTIRVVTEWSRGGRRYATCTSDAVAFSAGSGR